MLFSNTEVCISILQWPQFHFWVNNELKRPVKSHLWFILFKTDTMQNDEVSKCTILQCISNYLQGQITKEANLYEIIIPSLFYTASWNVWGEWFLAVNHHNHKNWVPSILTHNLWLIFMGMKQKKSFLKKQKKMAKSKNWVFQNRQFSIIFCENFMDWSLG